MRYGGDYERFGGWSPGGGRESTGRGYGQAFGASGFGGGGFGGSVGPVRRFSAARPYDADHFMEGFGQDAGGGYGQGARFGRDAFWAREDFDWEDDLGGRSGFDAYGVRGGFGSDRSGGYDSYGAGNAGYGDYAGYGGNAGYGGSAGYGGNAGYGGYGTDSGSAADRIRAGEIMTENPEAVTPDTTLADVAMRMRELNVGIIPVIDDAESAVLQGVITDRDITVRAVAEGADVSTAKVADFMSKDVESCRENDHVRDLFTVMKREQVRRVPITDRQGRLVGIVAQADLAVHYAGLDLEREREVEEVLERISEPAHPSWGRQVRMGQSRGGRDITDRLMDGWQTGQHELTDRLRDGWHTLRRGARELLGRGYDRGFGPGGQGYGQGYGGGRGRGYDRGW